MFLECLVGRIPEDRAVQILNPIFAAVGKRAGQKISMKIVEDDNVGPSILTALTWADMLGTDAKLIEIGNDAFELRLKGCLCRDSIPGVCVLMESFLAGMISALNPRIGMQFLRSTNDPDSYCRIFLTLRPLSHQNDNDPLLTLKMRLAKGEISEEEYIRKRMIILE
jgi:hypothetical protein